MDFNKISLKMKSKAQMIISYYDKTEQGFIKTDEKIINCTRKELEESLKDTKIKTEYVAEKPEKFQMGVLYVLETPKGQRTRIYTHQIN